MDALKKRIVMSAHDGALAELRKELGEDHEINLSYREGTEMMIRVKSGAVSPFPRYFKIKVSEAI